MLDKDLFNLKYLYETAKDWSVKKYESTTFQTIFKFSKYSDTTAPYKKCLEFVTATEDKVTKKDAPHEINCKRTICADPENTIKDVK